MGDEPTVEELIGMANNFLLNAPPGEFMEVVTDVRGLLADQESIINDSAPATFHEYNTEQMIQVLFFSFPFSFFPSPLFLFLLFWF